MFATFGVYSAVQRDLTRIAGAPPIAGNSDRPKADYAAVSFWPPFFYVRRLRPTPLQQHLRHG